jgi:hypothetical protein
MNRGREDRRQYAGRRGKAQAKTAAQREAGYTLVDRVRDVMERIERADSIAVAVRQMDESQLNGNLACPDSTGSIRRSAGIHAC